MTDTTEKVELDACKHCGGKARFFPRSDDFGASVECTGCHLRTSSYCEPDGDAHAIAAWNRRAVSELDRLLIEVGKAALERYESASTIWDVRQQRAVASFSRAIEAYLAARAKAQPAGPAGSVP